MKVCPNVQKPVQANPNRNVIDVEIITQGHGKP
jgi:hypothetical protein